MTLPEEFLAIAKRVNNWGRWGPEDEIGTLNLVTPEVVRKAAACVESGDRISLALALKHDGVQIGAIPRRVNPLRTMTMINTPLSRDPAGARTSDDVVFMGLQAGTHWDALSHMSYDGKLYNGFPASSIDERGAARCGIDKISTLVSRGVLLDVAATKGVERLEAGYAITPADLDAAEAKAGVRVEPGDIVLVRTGHVRLYKERKKQEYSGPSPGLGMASAEWFAGRDVAAVAADTLMLEVWPPEREDLAFPVHLLHLVDMGMTQGQNFDLEALSASCAADGRYAFLLEASPQPFERAVGSPVNPVAVK